MEALSADGIIKRHGRTAVLDGAALALAQGERAVVYGPTGCGKSTLLLVVAGLVRADAGRISLFGTLASGNGAFLEPEDRRLGVVFQKAVLWPHLTALGNVELALYREGLARAERRSRALEALELFGAAEFSGRRPETLSGGQAQRVALARSVAPKPRLLLWDEPFTGLDAAARDEVASRAGKWMQRERATLLAVSHHSEDAEALAARVLYLEDGKLVEKRLTSSLALAALAALSAAAGCRGRSEDAPPPGILAIWGAPGRVDGTFAKPRVIGCLPDGRLSIIDRSGRVQILAPGGRFLNKFILADTQRGYPTGMTVTPDGRLWIAETHAYRVAVYTPEGKELKAFGTMGTGDGQFVYVDDVAVAPSGRIYVSDYGALDRVQMFDSEGRFVKTIGGTGTEPGRFQRPRSVVVAPDGSIVVADAVNHRLQRFSADGEFLAAYGGPGSGPGQFRYPYDLAISPDGTLYVVEYGNCRVTRMTLDGKFLGTWGSRGSRPGQLADPWSCALDPQGMLYVLDSGQLPRGPARPRGGDLVYGAERLEPVLQNIPHIRFADATWLALLAAAPLMMWMARRSLAGLGRMRGMTAIAVRLAVLALVVSALARAQLVLIRDDMAVAYVVDKSLSIPIGSQQEALDFVASSHAPAGKRPASDKVALITFGQNAAIDQPFVQGNVDTVNLRAVVKGDHTDVAAGIRAAVAAMPQAGRKRIVLVTDGNENQGAALSEAASAKAAGIRVDCLPVRYGYSREVIVEKLVAPSDVAAGKTVSIRVLARAFEPSQGLMKLFANGVQIAEQTVNLKPGANVYVLEKTLDEPGVYDFKATVESPRTTASTRTTPRPPSPSCAARRRCFSSKARSATPTMLAEALVGEKVAVRGRPADGPPGRRIAPDRL